MKRKENLFLDIFGLQDVLQAEQLSIQLKGVFHL